MCNGIYIQIICVFLSKPIEILSRKQKERQIAETLPNNDPSYGFSFRTGVYSRREDADITGKVRGKQRTKKKTKSLKFRDSKQ